MMMFYVQVMAERTAAKTSIWPQLSRISMVPLWSTRWLAKKPRNRFNTVTQTPIYSLLHHWCICNQTGFLFMSEVALKWDRQSTLHAITITPKLLSGIKPRGCLKASMFPKCLFVFVKAEYQHSYQSCSFHGGISSHISYFIVNYVVFVNVAQYLSHSLVLKKLLYRETKAVLCGVSRCRTPVPFVLKTWADEDRLQDVLDTWFDFLLY